MKLITHINSALGRGGFLRQAAAIGFGSVAGQVVVIAGSFILTRIFSPDNFAVLAIYVSVVSLFFEVATGKYELAALLPDSEKEAINLITLSVFISTAVSILLAVLIFVIGDRALDYYELPHLKILLWLIPPGVAISAWQSSAMRWQTRKERFLTIGISKGLLGVSTIMFQVCVGTLAASSSAIVLVIGNVIGRFVGLSFLLRGMAMDLWNSRSDISCKQMWFVCKKYWKFPVYLGPSGLVGIATHVLPFVLIGLWFGETTLGYYALTERTLLLPTGLIGDSLGVVFFKRAALAKSDGVRSRSLLVKLSAFLLLIAIIPSLIIFFFGSELYGFAFGEQWERSGQLASAFIFLAITKFVVWPTRMLLQAVHSQLLSFIWFVVYFALTTGSFWFGKITNSVDNAIVCYSIISSFMFILYWVISFIVLGNVKSKNYATEA